MAKIDLASNSALLSVNDRLEEQNALLAAIAGGSGALPVKNWSTVQSIVRMGLAPKLFSVGDSLYCNHSELGEMAWDIVGIDCDMPADKTKEHSLTLMLKSPCVQLAFSEPEAMLYCQETMEAGTYYFDMPKTATTAANSYSFTTAMTHQSPNVIAFDTSTKKVIIYNDPTYSAVSETIKAAKGKNGTFLGTCDGVSLNSAKRISGGSDNWKSSDIRQWLSSSDSAGNWWKYSEDKGILNRPPSYASRAGFLNNIDADFAEVLGKVVKKTTKSDASRGTDETEDLVFLPSVSELYGSFDKSGEEGKAYPYFSDYSDNGYPSDNADSNRVKTGSDGYGTTYFTRSADVSGGSGTVWNVSTMGQINTKSRASMSGNVVPMCCVV